MRKSYVISRLQRQSRQASLQELLRRGPETEEEASALEDYITEAAAQLRAVRVQRGVAPRRSPSGIRVYRAEGLASLE